MNWLDLGIILVLALFIFLGIKRGLMNSVLSNFSLAINSLISFFLYKPFYYIYNKWFHIGQKISASYYAKFTANATEGSYLTKNLMEINPADIGDSVKTAVNESGVSFIPKTMFKIFLNKKTLPDTLKEKGYESRTVADIMSETYSTFFVKIIAFLTCLALVFLVVLLIKLLIDKLRKVGMIKVVDSVLGSAYGVFRCFIVLIILCFIIKLLSPFGFMHYVIDYINGSLFGKLVYTQINDFMNNYLNFSDIISSIFG